MNPFQFISNLLRINECPQAGSELQTPAHLKGKSGVSSLKTNLNVRFANSLPVEIKIQRKSLPENQASLLSASLKIEMEAKKQTPATNKGAT